MIYPLNTYHLYYLDRHRELSLPQNLVLIFFFIGPIGMETNAGTKRKPAMVGLIVTHLLVTCATGKCLNVQLN